MAPRPEFVVKVKTGIKEARYSDKIKAYLCDQLYM